MVIATSAQPRTAAPSRHPASLRLDLLANPYAPAPVVREHLNNADEASLPVDRLESILIARIARYHRVAPETIIVANGLAELLPALFRRVGSAGPLLVFPPADDEPQRLAQEAACDLIAVPRNPAFQVQASAIPNHPLGSYAAYCMSPNDPTGSQLRLQDAVTIARTVSHLVIDERHSAYAARDHLPLHREFDNVVLIRTLETWGGLPGCPLAYAIAGPAFVRETRDHERSGSVDCRSLLAGIAAFEHTRYLDAAASKITQERVALIRALRKLNMLRPLPSAANFVLATLELGNRDHLQSFLDSRGIAVHYPVQPGLENAIRISACSAHATSALCQALISWARDL